MDSLVMMVITSRISRFRKFSWSYDSAERCVNYRIIIFRDLELKVWEGKELICCANKKRKDFFCSTCERWVLADRLKPACATNLGQCIMSQC